MAMRQPGTGIPTSLSRFCGRRRELRALRDLLATDRLVTVVGTGGIGKTRLVAELARGAAFDFPDGVWFADLARVERAELVGGAIADAVHAPRRHDESDLERAARQLGPGRQLLVLDNCEHVLTAAAEATWHLLTGCATLTVLATSREALNVNGERTWRVLPLRVEADAEDVADQGRMSEAVELFCDRASLGEPGSLSAGAAAAVREICRRVDGMPLALELTAAWVPTLSLDDVVGRLDEGVTFLQRDDVGRPPRHHSVHASLEWSLRMLPASHAHAFDVLSVFVGGCSLDGAEAVLQPAADDEATLEVMQELVRRSLVVVSVAVDPTRYRLLEPVRQYAAERLRTRPADEHEVRRRHLEYLAALAEAHEEPLAGGPDQPPLRLLDAELGNIRAALAWGFDHEPVAAARLTTALMMYCWYRELFNEGLSWAVRAGDATGRTRARAMLMAGWMSGETGAHEPAAAFLAEAYGLAVAGRWSFDVVMVLHATALAAYVRGDVDAMTAAADEGLEWARRDGRDVAMMWALWAPGVVAALRGEHQRGLEVFLDALAIAERLDNHSWRASVRSNVIESAIDLDDYATAAHHLTVALDSPAVEDVTLVGYMLESAGILAQVRGDNLRALQLLGASRAAFTRSGYRETPDEADRRGRWVDAARNGIAEPDVAWRAGLDLGLPAALAEARAAVREGGDGGAETIDGVDEPAPNALVREGEYWSLTYAVTVSRVKHSKGLHDIARIIAAGGRGVAAVDLVGDEPRVAALRPAGASQLGLAPEGDAGDVLDAAARVQYRARLVDLEADIADADTANDPERAARARDERRFLLDELGAAVGLGGRPRRALDPVERARKTVTWRIRDAISRIEAAHPELGRHLRRAVRTGTFCVYDPDVATTWRLET